MIVQQHGKNDFYFCRVNIFSYTQIPTLKDDRQSKPENTESNEPKYRKKHRYSTTVTFSRSQCLAPNV